VVTAPRQDPVGSQPIPGAGSGWAGQSGRSPYQGTWQAGARPSWAGDTVQGYAQWGSRVLATLIDNVLLLIPTLVVLYALGDDGSPMKYNFTLDLVLFACAAPYFTVLGGGRLGQTLGYRTLNIVVRDARSGNPIGYPKAFVRYLVRFLAYVFGIIPGLVNDLWPLWDPMRQTLADKAVGAVVVQLGQR
jgi:uncharacterized RDD family membrane protein YckC